MRRKLNKNFRGNALVLFGSSISGLDEDDGAFQFYQKNGQFLFIFNKKCHFLIQLLENVKLIIMF
ncbi:MAG: hypothetical protein LW706_10320, partial [Chitinophagaceae bacterium]|nr:hypothetical protein [Chitinophagaceae bacterium]MCE2758323.1 hypothetical protein [Chitinophagaceae bacterium]